MAMDNFLSYVLLTKVGGIYRQYAIRTQGLPQIVNVSPRQTRTALLVALGGLRLPQTNLG